MLSDDITRYLELHRALGFKYKLQSYLLRHFAAFAGTRGEAYVRAETVIAWATGAPSAPQRRKRLLVVRQFSVTMQAEDPRYELPPADAFGRCERKRRIPHIYSPDEIRSLLRAAAELTPKDSIHAITYVTLFALLVSTGLRISEALALQLDDITPDGLVIRETKFRKNRLVPLHSTSRAGLDRYIAIRTRMDTIDHSLLISLRHSSLSYVDANRVFLRLMRSIGLRGAPGSPGPTLHDMRHTFAVRSLEACIGRDEEVARHILALSTYLGHAHPSDTYWYLQATPKIMENISCFGERLFNGGAA